MRIILQTLSHGSQFGIAHQRFQKYCNVKHQHRIIEIQTLPPKKTKVFAKLSFYIKRKKILALLMNLLARLAKKKIIEQYRNKNIEVERILSSIKKNQSINNLTKVKNINEAKEIIFNFKPDVVLVIGSPYLPSSYFMPGTRYINLHIGKIPEYRGLKCIEWALLKRDYKAIGFTVHEMTSSLDLGTIYSFGHIDPKGKNLSQIYAECYQLGIKRAIEIACDENKLRGDLPKTEGKVYHSIDFNGFVIEKLLKQIDC